jgi:2,4-dienoyl-CoA reductase-like NADH-dependent reductase (Old Yellow Enzyme family)
VGINDSAAGRPMWVPSVPDRPSAVDPLFSMISADELAKQMEPYTRPGARIEHHVMTVDDIATAVGWFAAAARRARDAGIDAVELHAGHGYLIDEFLSPASNHRDDQYGGPIEHRARFLVETIQAIRGAVGADYPLWCRINGHEFFADGTKLDDALRTARLAVDAGVDAIHVSAYADPARAAGFTEAHTTHFPGHFVKYASAVKQVVPVPVIGVGRIEPDDADRWIGEGVFDFVALGRKLLADPELPNKLAAGRRDDVRPCMYHYRCIGQIFIREGVRCAMNPATGREAEFALQPAAESRRVLVVGGGPAGLEAARIAALRGHSVVLHEASARLGGKLAYAATTYAPNADVLAWLTTQVGRLGVDVRLAAPVDDLAAVAAGFDAVVVAVGGRWERPDVTGGNGPWVRTVDELDGWLLHGEPLDGHHVVVLGGGRAGCGLADLAARQGHDVSIVESGPVLSSQIGLPGRWRVVHDLWQRNVDTRTNSQLSRIEDHTVYITSDDHDDKIHADIVLVASRIEPNLGLLDRVHDVEVRAIGDCASAGFIEGAMLDAARVAMSL